MEIYVKNTHIFKIGRVFCKCSFFSLTSSRWWQLAICSKLQWIFSQTRSIFSNFSFLFYPFLVIFDNFHSTSNHCTCNSLCATNSNSQSIVRRMGYSETKYDNSNSIRRSLTRQRTGQEDWQKHQHIYPHRTLIANWFRVLVDLELRVHTQSSHKQSSTVPILLDTVVRV